MIEYRCSTPVILALILAINSVTLSGCGKKESQQTSSLPSIPISQTQPSVVAAVVPQVAAPTDKAAAPMASTEVAMRKSDCFTCHAVDKKIVGPAYSWVAYRYRGDKEAAANLFTKVKNGGTGKWNDYTGGIAMSPHQQLPDDEIKAMVQWVLNQNPIEPPKIAAK